MEDISITIVIVYPLLSSSQPSERETVITPLAIRPEDIYWLAQGHTAGVQRWDSTPGGKLSAGPGREAARQRLSLDALPTALSNRAMHGACTKLRRGGSDKPCRGSQGGLLEEVTLSSLPLEPQGLQYTEKQGVETSPGERTWSLPALRGPPSRASHGSSDLCPVPSSPLSG